MILGLLLLAAGLRAPQAAAQTDPGDFLGIFVLAGSGGLNSPEGLVFGADGHLYVSSASSDEVLRYVSPIPTRYVSPTGTNAGNDCTDVSNPCRTIAYAVAQANGGDTIHLASGVYHESGLVIDKALIIVGHGAVVQ